MTLEEIFKQKTADEVVSDLKNHRITAQPNVEQAKKALDPKLHDINDKIIRPDKRVKIDGGNDSGDKVIDTGEDGGNYRIEKVARVAVALQKLIINRAVSFVFGNPVAYNATPETNKQEAVLKALNRVLYDNKTTSLNRKIARSIFGFKECAELWYVQEKAKSHNTYGFLTKSKLRCALFSPMFGDTLYPYFDGAGDLVAFSRSYSRIDSDKNRFDYFETYTDTEHWLWVNGANGYEVVDGFPKKVAIGKIPIVYGHQEYFETQEVDSLIDRLEKLLSNFADTNDYHASPKIFVTGQINGWSKKGEAGAVIEGEEGATMNYVSWQNAPESVKLEIETLLKMIYTITQTPDISFESVKGLGAITGIALKLLFMDAHLKVQDKKEVFDGYLQRRVNVIKTFIGQFNTDLEEDADLLEIEPEITPYMLTNELDEINMWLAANGNKPLVSQKASVKGANLTQDPEKDFEQIQEEASAENSFSIGEPVIDA
uniref:Portal protein n=1 Tax=Siphoviridae sp. ctnks32 TaxID=2826457 RepID=A0A8S5N1F9_9CAUD|nr:MAG TPA: portal protein [Siphoviridae sp. ctnks32]